MGIRGPQPHAQFLTRDDFAWFFEQREQNLVDLALQLQPRTVPRHFLSLLINLKRPEMDITTGGKGKALRRRRLIRFPHGDHFR